MVKEQNMTKEELRELNNSEVAAVNAIAKDRPLDLLKEDRLILLKEECYNSIKSGFESNALGSTHTYQSDRDDQLNLIGAIASGEDTLFKCFDGSAWSYKNHTPQQLKAVINDGKQVKLLHLQKYGTLKDKIVSALSKTELESIVW